MADGLSGRALGWLRALLVGVVVAAMGCAGLAVAPAARAATVAPNPDPSLISQWQPCQPGTGVTVIVDFESLGTGQIEVGCALGAQTDGVTALQNAGFSITGTGQYGNGFICRINDLPSPASQSCVTTPPSSAYWSYWTASQANSTWGYSSTGASDDHPAIGTFQGWAFSTAQGTTVFPRIPPMDSTGPAQSTNVPATSSATAAKLGTGWLLPILENLTGPDNAGANPPTSASGTVTNDLKTFMPAFLPGMLQAGLTREQLAPLVGLMRTADESWVMPDSDTFQGYRAAPLLVALAALHESTDDAEVASLRDAFASSLYPSGSSAGPAGWYASSSMSGEPSDTVSVAQQAQVVQGLAETGGVPAAAVNALLGAQQTDGEFVSHTCPPDYLSLCPASGDYTGVANTEAAVVALVAVERAGAGAVADGTVDPAQVRAALGAAGAFLTGLQQPDGGYVGGYPSGGGQGLETVWTTAQAATALAAVGDTKQARAASRWLAGMQLTAPTGAAAGLAGWVAADSNFLTADEANGFGFDPDTIAYVKGTAGNQIYNMISTDLPDVAVAAQAWTVAPFADAQVVSASVKAGSTSATVTVKVGQGTAGQSVVVSYGPTEGTQQNSAAKAVLAGSGTVTLRFALSTLQAATPYSYHVVLTGTDKSTVTGPIGTFTTTQATTGDSSGGTGGTATSGGSTGGTTTGGSSTGGSSSGGTSGGTSSAGGSSGGMTSGGTSSGGDASGGTSSSSGGSISGGSTSGGSTSGGSSSGGSSSGSSLGGSSSGGTPVISGSGGGSSGGTGGVVTVGGSSGGSQAATASTGQGAQKSTAGGAAPSPAQTGAAGAPTPEVTAASAGHSNAALPWAIGGGVLALLALGTAAVAWSRRRKNA